MWNNPQMHRGDKMTDIQFASPEQILADHPNCGWGGPNGEIGDAVTMPDGTQHIALYVGAGRTVLISEKGVYDGDDHSGVKCVSRVSGGAWISREFYNTAVRRHRESLK